MTASLNQTFQLILWGIALLQFILGLYTLVLNSRHTANQHVFAFLLLLSVNSFAAGMMMTATSAAQARLPAILIAITAPAIQPTLLLTSIALLKPNVMRGRWQWLKWIPRILASLPFVLTLIDLALGSRLYYTGLNPATYAGGLVAVEEIASGILQPLFLILNFGGISLVTAIALLYIALLDKTVATQSRALAGIFLIALVTSSALDAFLAADQIVFTVLAMQLVYFLAYGYATYQQMISERRLRSGSLQTRLLWSTLVIAIPLLASMAIFLTDRARQQIERDVVQNLSNLGQSLSASVSLWLNTDLAGVIDLAVLPEITSMNAEQQKPLLEGGEAGSGEKYLLSTVDSTGINVARSDNNPPKDYSNEAWFQKVISGAPAAYQAVMERSIWIPDLIVAVPIKGDNNQVVGAVMSASDLTEINRLFQATRVGSQGFALLIDDHNQLIAHPDWALAEKTQYAMQDMSAYPPVQALRQGLVGASQFSDAQGESWRASITLLENGWGVILQQPESELLASMRGFTRIAWIVLGLGAAILFALAWLTIRQGLQPIQSLTETATAIAAGDLSRMAPIESDGELGLLAKTFNSMTGQLNESITGLESRVTERTQVVQRRALQLQVTAEVAREAATIRDLEQLLDHTAHLISERFGFYHCGIFLTQSSPVGTEQGGYRTSGGSGGYAVLRAASSEGGKRMLARGHKLKIGETGIVGYVAATGEARIALDVGTDAVFFNNPDLPLTRSEMALPLRVRDQIIGALDVQSTTAGAFTEEDIATLQILADQIAVAIENTLLLSESQRVVRELEALYGGRIRQAWKERLQGRPLGYEFSPTGVRPLQSVEGSLRVVPSKVSSNEADSSYEIELPIELRRQQLGSLGLKRSSDQAAWTPREQQLIRDAINQVALALENARLLEEIQQHAFQEEIINQIVAKMQGTLDVEAVMKTTVREIGQVINAAKIQLRLGKADSGGAPSAALGAPESGDSQEGAGVREPAEKERQFDRLDHPSASGESL